MVSAKHTQAEFLLFEKKDPVGLCYENVKLDTVDVSQSVRRYAYIISGLVASMADIKGNVKVAKDYMTVCFMPSLTPSQTRTANEKGWTTIYDFDLASILRVIKFNLRSIPSFIPSRKDEITVSDMIEIRNEYAHSNGWDITNENAIDDISTMSDFIKLMGGDRETIDEMQDFMSTIPV